MKSISYQPHLTDSTANRKSLYKTQYANRCHKRITCMRWCMSISREEKIYRYRVGGMNERRTMV